MKRTKKNEKEKEYRLFLGRAEIRNQSLGFGFE